MVSCKHCSTQNSLDSTFCKRCGTAIDESALAEATTKLEKLIEEGNSLFNQGRTEEAMAVADACVVSNPSSSAAWSLKVLCHERKHEIAEALECAEKIVELNPDSELDKIKRNALRTRLQADLRPVETPNRTVAVIGAIASIALVSALGVAIARITSSGTVQTTNTPESKLVADNGGAVSFDPASQGNLNAVNPGQTANPNPTNAQNPNQDQPGPGDVPNIDNRNRPESTPATAPRQDSNDPRVPPLPVFGGGAEIRPENPPSPPDQGDRGNGGGGVKNEEDPRDLPPEPEKGQGRPVPTDPPVVAENPDGQIEIKVTRGGSGSRGGSVPAGGSTPVMNSNGLETLLRVGTQQYQLGNYSGAVRSYEQALQAGGDGVILNQRIGQSYERLGRSNDAAAAYRACISACDSALSSGRGNRAKLESVKASAQAALKVLQGG